MQISDFHIINDKDFEFLLMDIFNSIHDTGTYQIYGRNGQGQSGVDVFSKEKKTAIQCKYKKDTKLTDKVRDSIKKEIRNEAIKAKDFKIEITTYYYATTYPHDTVLQDYVAQISDEFPFSIIYMGWDEIRRIFLQFPRLFDRYFKTRTPLDPSQEQAQVYRYLDKWSSFIQNSSIEIGEKEYSGNKITELLCKEFYTELESYMVDLGRHILREQFNDPDITNYVFTRIYQHQIRDLGYDFLKQAKADFIKGMNSIPYCDRWEYQKNVIGSSRPNEIEKRTLQGLGSINFYKIGYYNDGDISRHLYYKRVVYKLSKVHSSFIDGFINSIQACLQVVDQSTNSKKYTLDIAANFKSKFDYLFLLYLLLAKELPVELVDKINKYISFDSIANLKTSRHMLDSPFLNELKAEIEFALSKKEEYYDYQ